MSKEYPIILVDDDLEDHMIMDEYFSSFGLKDKVYYLTSGERVMNYLSSLADDGLPDIILLDLNMPIMNGTQTLIQIKRDARLKDIPVAIYSTSDNENERRKALSFGAVAYLVKPMTYEAGLSMVKQVARYVTDHQLLDTLEG